MSNIKKIFIVEKKDIFFNVEKGIEDGIIIPKENNLASGDKVGEPAKDKSNKVNKNNKIKRIECKYIYFYIILILVKIKKQRKYGREKE